MKRTLLLSALAAFGLASMAQTQLQEVNLSGRNAVTTLSLNQKAVNKARKALQASKVGARITTVTPTAFYARPEGGFWLGANNQFNAYQGYLVAPANIALEFQGVMVGEKCMWKYADPAQKVSENQQEYTYLTKDIHGGTDSVLTVTYPAATLPAPQLICTSKVGSSPLNAKTKADTFSVGNIIAYGGGALHKESLYPCVNYDINRFVGTISVSDYFGFNNDKANTNITKTFSKKYGNQDLKVTAAYELFRLNSNATAYVLGGDAMFYSDNAEDVKVSDVVVDLIPLENGRLASEPMQAQLTVDKVTLIPAQGQQAAIYVVHFAAKEAIAVNQSVMVRVRPSATSTKAFSPVPMISQGMSDGQTGYGAISFNYKGKDYKDLPLSINIFQFDNDGKFHAFNWGIGLDLTYNQKEANAYTGIATPNTAVRVSNATYDLQGRRVENSAKGLYIQNGKKVYVK